MQIVYNDCLYESQDTNKRNNLEYIFDKYGEDSGYYITFHNIEKVGINPHTVWNTPNGIYSYPLDHYFDRNGKMKYEGTLYDSDGKMINENIKPKYVSILKSTTQLLALRKITREEISNYFNILCEYVQKIASNDEHFIQFISERKNRDRFLYRIIEFISTGNSSIPRSEGGIFWTMTLIFAILFKASKLDMCFKVISNFVEIKTDILSNIPVIGGKYPINQWNKVFEVLGINGVVDLGGGIIHINEPTQAIFFNTHSFSIIETINYRNTLVAGNDYNYTVNRIYTIEISLNALPNLIKNGFDWFRFLSGTDFSNRIKFLISYKGLSDNTKKYIKSLLSTIDDDKFKQLAPISINLLTGHDAEVSKRILSLITNQPTSYNIQMRVYFITEIADILKNDKNIDDITTLAKKSIKQVLQYPNDIDDNLVNKIINDLNMKQDLS